MREIRQPGSEGGKRTNRLSLPLLKPLGRGLGVGRRKRKNVGVKARGKRDASWGKKKSKSKKCLM